MEFLCCDSKIDGFGGDDGVDSRIKILFLDAGMMQSSSSLYSVTVGKILSVPQECLKRIRIHRTPGTFPIARTAICQEDIFGSRGRLNL